jgi:hypothetical protein
MKTKRLIIVATILITALLTTFNSSAQDSSLYKKVAITIHGGYNSSNALKLYDSSTNEELDIIPSRNDGKTVTILILKGDSVKSHDLVLEQWHNGHMTPKSVVATF